MRPGEPTKTGINDVIEGSARRHGVSLPHQRLEVVRPANLLMLEKRPDGGAIPAVRDLVDLQAGRRAAAAAGHGENIPSAVAARCAALLRQPSVRYCALTCAKIRVFGMGKSAGKWRPARQLYLMFKWLLRGGGD
jgi:hypothetical protein